MRKALSSLSFAAAVLAGIVSTQAPARAADLKVVCFATVKAAFDELAPLYEKTRGGHIVLQYESSVNQKTKLEGGEPFDVAIGYGRLMTSLEEKDLVLKDSVAPVSSLWAVMAYRRGEPAPGVATMDALKATVLKAKSISFSDPAAGGTSSIYFASLVKTLGVENEVKAKAIITKPGQGAFPVGEGKAEIGVAQSSEAALVAGVDSVRLFPSDPKSQSSFSMAVSSKTSQPEAARAFQKFLTSPEAVAVLKSKGIFAD